MREKKYNTVAGGEWGNMPRIISGVNTEGIEAGTVNQVGVGVDDYEGEGSGGNHETKVDTNQTCL